ncbi:MAG: 4-hydroxy-tetrahydrodipicolinate synthase [Prevotellaceae bacterium]|jgi:4-hydroxy-tetrahydrodipicolinate synthase|nr:4-hydroxy-tetrahydrodipicolinate synthase [Prevotellaceae bacterium]
MASKITGTGVALVTPFDAKGRRVDYAALTKLVNFVADNGVNFLVALGTTAETPTLSTGEKKEVLSCIKSSNTKKLPIALGIGGNNTANVLERIQQTDFNGIDALLSVTPYYNKPSQQGLYEHFKAIAAASPVPLLLYNVPARTGVNLSAETTLRLAREVKNIMGIKEASGNLSQISHILRDKPEDFVALSGDDALTLPLMAVGAHGVISVAANAFPKQVVDMVKLAGAQKYSEAAKIHLAMTPLVDALFAEGNPVGVKAALSVQGIIGNVLRLPLVSATEGLVSSIAALIKQLDDLKNENLN